MTHTLEHLSADIGEALKANSGAAGKQAVCKLVSTVLLDDEFVAKTYVMRPGDSHFYDVGVVHSPKRDGFTELVRIEGGNLDRIQCSNIRAA